MSQIYQINIWLQIAEMEIILVNLNIIKSNILWKI